MLSWRSPSKAQHTTRSGAAILRLGERKINERGLSGICMNARIKAVGFYEILGYCIHGNEFEIQGVGAHFKMRKKIDK